MEIFYMEIFKWSFMDKASVREPPALQASALLWERFLHEGFLTSTEPLLAYGKPLEEAGDLRNFSVEHVESQTRT